jgi:intracellular septation protein
VTKKELIINMLAEFLPIAAFVVASETVGFRYGLRVLIIATAIALVLSILIEKRIPRFGLFASGTIFLFASLSMAFRTPFFIIIKDTLYYAGFGVALLVGIFIERSPFKFFFEDFMAISERGWRIISLRWTVFFFLLAIGNELARHMLSPEDWTLYKLVALFITWGFGFYQLTVTSRERLPGASSLGLRITPSHGE